MVQGWAVGRIESTARVVYVLQLLTLSIKERFNHLWSHCRFWFLTQLRCIIMHRIPLHWSQLKLSGGLSHGNWLHEGRARDIGLAELRDSMAHLWKLDWLSRWCCLTRISLDHCVIVKLSLFSLCLHLNVHLIC